MNRAMLILLWCILFCLLAVGGSGARAAALPTEVMITGITVQTDVSPATIIVEGRNFGSGLELFAGRIGQDLRSVNVIRAGNSLAEAELGDISPGEYRVVLCSGREAAQAQFSLTTAGEVLLLLPGEGQSLAESAAPGPRETIQGTLGEAIRVLESYECVVLAVDFLNPIKLARIEDLETYKQQRQCSKEDPGNVEEVILALKLARVGVPEIRGVTATISLADVGLAIDEIQLMKYVDGKWYFNDF